jgi:hypothetical protein
MAKELGMELKLRSKPGDGWNAIKNRMEDDLTQWAKDDRIIISPSCFIRLNLFEMEIEPLGSAIAADAWPRYLKDAELVATYQEDRWYRFVTNLQHLGYDVWTWAWNPTRYTMKNIIPPPEGFEGWERWNEARKHYWIATSPVRDAVVSSAIVPNDPHWNNEGHEVIAKYMLGVMKE